MSMINVDECPECNEIDFTSYTVEEDGAYFRIHECRSCGLQISEALD